MVEGGFRGSVRTRSPLGARARVIKRRGTILFSLFSRLDQFAQLSKLVEGLLCLRFVRPGSVKLSCELLAKRRDFLRGSNLFLEARQLSR